MPAVAKLDIPGSSLTWGYESELMDRALRKCVVTGAVSKEDAISTAVTAAQTGGQNLYSSVNIPLQGASCIRLGADRWMVDLQYARSRISQRRNAAERRVSVTTVNDFTVPVYLVTQNRACGLPFENITSWAPPAGAAWSWYRMQFVPGTNKGQDSRFFPQPYLFRRPQFRIQLNYTTTSYTFGFNDVNKVGKANSNTYFIPEIGGMFTAGQLYYEGYGTEPRDISRFAATVNFLHTPGGFCEQVLKWNNGSVYPNDRYWYVENQFVYETAVF
jgi:hypothetical protein